MIYMTFKIKKDWLFMALATISGIFNVISLVLLAQGITTGNGALIAFGALVSVILLAINFYTLFNVIKSYKIGLTKDSIKISDFSRMEIPYNAIRSIKKEREPSKYGLYDALLVIKYNKFDTIKVNVEDLENVFDNLKEMVQKANLDKVVNSVVTKKDGSREIQQNMPTSAGTANGMGGATVIIPATSSPTGNTIVQPNATTATVVRSGTPQPTAGAMVRPAQPMNQQATVGAMVRPVTGQPVQRTVVQPGQRPVTGQPTAGAMVRPANANQQVVRSTNTVVRPVQTAPQPVARTTTTTTTTTKQAGEVSAPGTTQSTVVNPDGSRRIITTTTTVKPTE